MAGPADEGLVCAHGDDFANDSYSVFLRVINLTLCRRWKILFPHEVPLLQAARKIQKAALISNFVDREEQRPALGPCDFVSASLEINSLSEYGNKNSKAKRRKKSWYDFLK